MSQHDERVWLRHMLDYGQEAVALIRSPVATNRWAAQPSNPRL